MKNTNCIYPENWCEMCEEYDNCYGDNPEYIELPKKLGKFLKNEIQRDHKK